MKPTKDEIDAFEAAMLQAPTPSEKEFEAAKAICDAEIEKIPKCLISIYKSDPHTVCD